MRWPKVIPANQVDRTSVVSGLDFLPTLCAFAGVQINNAEFEGEDMSAAFQGMPQERNSPLFWKISSSNSKISMREGKWKIHQKGSSTYTLYDLELDAEELVDVSSQHPEIVQDMTTKMVQWKANLPQTYIKK